MYYSHANVAAVALVMVLSERFANADLVHCY